MAPNETKMSLVHVVKLQILNKKQRSARLLTAIKDCNKWELKE